MYRGADAGEPRPGLRIHPLSVMRPEAVELKSDKEKTETEPDDRGEEAHVRGRRTASRENAELKPSEAEKQQKDGRMVE